jgi:hypothetical protein
MDNVRMLSREEILRRDEQIMAMFIAGRSEREIGRAVHLTGPRVHQIIHRELDNSAQHRQLLSDEALTIYICRLETLIKAVWPAVLRGDLKAVDTARRVLAAEARLFGLEVLGAAVPSPAELEFDPGFEQDVDELARFRRAHRRRGD